ncbi:MULTISPECIES: DUF262 domain-containing protein [unclassified Empedobacter]|uniref:GmrSD restriction endonuclease domain-containing protein n=1 Tax=unclassified Empedobacter TaxID=2643773 RepID=UPI0025C52190|nr:MULTISPECIES: DUF262 domain-containing protein [unclassified Empedobacter]
MNLTKSFHDIISEHVVEVPIIQREYAQGRKTEKVKSIRKRFVRDLVKSIIDNREIHLGFVYGKIDGKENLRRKVLNREAVNSILEAVKFYANNLELKINANIEEVTTDNSSQTILKFIPLDGQQRLTTLYILYWYLYFKGAKTSSLDWLQHFKYTNRKSALAFCNELTEVATINILREKLKNNPKSNIKELITNSSFYLKKWNKDATVSGMLEMLLSIEKEFDSHSGFDFTSQDLENLPFKFDFMDLDSLNQTDELYVKMNSRGKQLSDYEHFKSWLQEKHNNTIDSNWFESFWKRLDTDWLNYFWRKVNVDFNALDDYYYNYIKNLALMYCLSNNTEIPFDNFKDLYSQIRNTEIYDNKKISYIPLENFIIKWEKDGEEKEFFLFNEDTLRFIEKTFNSLLFLEKDNNYKELGLGQIICKPFIDTDISDLFLKDSTFTPSLWNTVFYYAFIIFINDREHSNYSNDALKQWLRYTRNTVYNTYIQSPENYNSALKQLKNLEPYKFNIGQAILRNEVENVFFENPQFEEEKIKLDLLGDNDWQEPIIEAENHPYLFGQIKFLLDFSKDESSNYVLEDFIKYSQAVSILYNKEIRQHSNKILERFLLCQGFYLPYYKADYIFCSGSLGGLRTKNENWRLFFKGDKIKVLKKSIDKLEGKDITVELLENYISNHLNIENLKESDFKYLFLKYPKAIDYCKETAIRKESDNDIRLLKGFPIYAYHVELRTYCFFLDNKNEAAAEDNRIAPEKYYPFTKFWYFEEKNTDGHPGFYLGDFSLNEKEYRLDVRYSKSKEEFELCFYHNTDEKEYRNSDINLSKLNFVFDQNHKHLFKSVLFEDIEIELNDLCSELNNLKKND